jgi:hypothetical protein
MNATYSSCSHDELFLRHFSTLNFIFVSLRLIKYHAIKMWESGGRTPRILNLDI